MGGGDRRQRSMAVVGVLAAITGLSGVSAATSAGGDRPSFARTAVASPASASPTTVVDEPVAVPPASTSTSSSSVPRSTTTTTSLVCRNSTDPRCGPFYWDPDPGPNQPLTVTVRYVPEHPHAGEAVTFYVTAHDPDAQWFWGVGEEFGDDPRGGAAIDGMAVSADDQPDYCEAQKFGPWTPPPRVDSAETLGNTPESGVPHTYSAAGTYTARFWFRSDSTRCGLHEPYGSSGEQSVQVVVEPDDTTSSTTTTTR